MGQAKKANKKVKELIIHKRSNSSDFCQGKKIFKENRNNILGGSKLNFTNMPLSNEMVRGIHTMAVVTKNEHKVLKNIENYHVFYDQAKKERFINTYRQQKVNHDKINDNYKVIKEFINTINDQELRRCVKNIFNIYDEHFIKYVPAANSVHHSEIGGLVEHTIEVVEFARMRMRLEINRKKELNKPVLKDSDIDLITAGCLIHDLGKINEYALYENEFHIDSLRKNINRLANSDTCLTRKAHYEKLGSIVDSHHGLTEWGAKNMPKDFIENTVFEADYYSANITKDYRSKDWVHVN